LFLLLPLLLFGVAWRKPRGGDPQVPAKAANAPLDIEAGALEPLATRLTNTEIQNPAFGLLPRISDVKASLAVVTPQQHDMAQFTYMTRSPSYEDVLGELNAEMAQMAESSAVEAAGVLPVGLAGDMPTIVVPVDVRVARTNSHYDTEPSNVDIAPLKRAHTGGSSPSVMTFITPEPDNVGVLSAFQNRNSMYVDNNDSISFKSVHRTNPLAALAKQNRRVAVVADELDGLEMQTPQFGQTGAGVNPEEVGQMAVPGSRLSISLAESFAQDIDLDDSAVPGPRLSISLAESFAQDIDLDDSAVPIPRLSISLAESFAQDIDLDDSAVPGPRLSISLAESFAQDIDLDDSDAIVGDQTHIVLAGSGTQDIDLDGAATLGDQGSITLAADPSRQDINVDTDVPAHLQPGHAPLLGTNHSVHQDDDQDGYLAFTGDGVPLALGHSEDQVPETQSEYLAVAEDSPGVFDGRQDSQSSDHHYGHLAVAAGSPEIFSARSANCPNVGGGDDAYQHTQEEYLAVVENADQEQYLAVNGGGPEAFYSSCGNHPQIGSGNKSDQQEEYLAVEDADQEGYLAVNSEGHSADSIRRSQTQLPCNTTADDDDQDEYLLVNAPSLARLCRAAGHPAIRAMRGSLPAVGGGSDDDEQSEYLGVAGSGTTEDASSESDSQSEYMEMFDGHDPAALKSAKLVQNRPDMLPDVDEEEQYVTVGGSHANCTPLSTQWVVGEDGDSVAISSARMVWLDENQNPASRPISADSVAASETETDPKHRDVFFARQLQLSDSDVHTDEAHADPQEGELPDQFFGSRAQNDAESNLVLDDRFFGLRDVHLDAKEGATAGSRKASVEHYEEHGTIGTALRAPNSHSAASPQDWRLSAAALSDGDDTDDDVAEAAGGLSASMFGAASRKVGVRPSNRKIGANFGGQFRQRQAAPPQVETENVFVADMKAKVVRLASVQRNPRRGRNEMAAATMTEEKSV